MGKPRMLIIIRHAQSEGNKNKQIHQDIPDHRVKLTSEGWSQAREAGNRLRSMLRPDDTLHFYASPYRRTRETTEGILESLTSDDPTPSPFRRSAIKVWHDPRLREQSFGNFQPCSAAMERMWQERADYGHFFYRIPNGESAADVYDRVSGFNESLWRSFEDDDFASVCVLVTHGLMARVFLMKWYHWSVEYFEDLRNVNHCEFLVMKRRDDNKKYELQTELRTWSELRRQRDLEDQRNGVERVVKPTVRKQWGGCPGGCNHKSSEVPHEVVVSKNTSAKTTEQDTEAFPNPDPSTHFKKQSTHLKVQTHRPAWLQKGRDFGGSFSGVSSPTEELSPKLSTVTEANDQQKEEPTEEPGMASGAFADALGDQKVMGEDLEEAEARDRSIKESVY